MGSASALTNENNFDDSRVNLTQSPVMHEHQYSPSPSTSTSFNYGNTPSRSVPDLQIPITPKNVVQQQQQQQPSPQQSSPQMKTSSKQQPIPKPSVVIQQCIVYGLLIYVYIC